MKRRDFPFIRLAPWEHLPSATPENIEARAQHVTPFQWHRQHFEVAARMADIGNGTRFIFVQFVGVEDEANWVLGLGKHDDSPQTCYGQTPLKISKRLKGRVRGRYFPFGRLFHFEPNELGIGGVWRAWVAANGSARWTNAQSDDPLESDELFRLPLAPGESFLNVPACQVKERLLAEVRREDSDAHFALHWYELGVNERENLVLKVKRGAVEELRRVLSCALQIEPIVQSQQAQWNWNVAESDSDWENLTILTDDRMLDWVRLPARLRFWKRMALTYFVPYPDESLLRRHHCARLWFTNRETLFNIELRPPTHHERLEAALFLRDWAHGKVAPRKLHLLLAGV